MEAIVDRAKSRIIELIANRLRIIQQREESKRTFLRIQESLKCVIPEGHSLRICGPVQLDQKEYYINLVEKKELLQRRLAKVIVTDDKFSEITEHPFIKKTIQTSAVSSLILQSKFNFPANIRGTLSEIDSALEELRSISLKEEKTNGLQNAFLSVEQDINKLKKLGENLGKIFDDLAQSKVPSYETIDPLEEVITKIKSRYVFLIQDCEVLFEYDRNMIYGMSFQDSRKYREIKYSTLYHLSVLRSIVKHLSDLLSRTQKYISYFLSVL